MKKSAFITMFIISIQDVCGMAGVSALLDSAAKCQNTCVKNNAHFMVTIACAYSSFCSTLFNVKFILQINSTFS